MKLKILSTPSVKSEKKGTIVFCHGAWHDARCWQPTMMPYFAELGYDCIAPSYRNHGSSESSGSLKLRRINEYVADVQSVVNTLEGNIFLIGHSMGGLVVQKYLERYPNRIEKAVLLCSVPPHGVWRVTLKNALHFPLQFLKANLFWTLRPFISTLKLFRLHFYTEGVSDTDLKELYAQTQDESFLAFLDMLFLNLPKVSKIHTPLLILGGGTDYFFPPIDVHKTAIAYGTSAIIYENEAHNLFLEKNWQQAAQAMANFMLPL